MDHNAPHNPRARACIKHPAAHQGMKFGKCHPQFNPHFQVENQGEPTPEHPVPLHKTHKGHGKTGSLFIPTPHLRSQMK